MSILTIGSTNPKFSYIISKNPATIRDSKEPFKRTLRQGAVYGWFPKPDDLEFRLWFKDHPTKSSFADGALGDFEYLDRTRYGSPYLPIMMVQTCLATASKARQEDDTGPYSTFVRSTIKVSSLDALEKLASHFSNDSIVVYEEVHGRYYDISVSADSVFEALNIFQTICILMAMRDTETYVRLDRTGVDKYLRVLNNANAPYYVRYQFAMKAINNRSLFDQVRENLQGPGMSMVYGDTRQQRYDAIQAELKGGEGTSLIDIGCGEMFYALRMSKRYDLVTAVDADEETSTNNAGKIAGRKVENVDAVHAEATPGWVSESASLFEGADVLMSEVLEHVERKESDALLQAVLASDARKVVVTVPNGAFNVNYGIAEGKFRHSDHKFEPTFEEWCDYTVIVATLHGWSVDNVPIGDVVNDQSVSTMSVFTKESK